MWGKYTNTIPSPRGNSTTKKKKKLFFAKTQRYYLRFYKIYKNDWNKRVKYKIFRQKNPKSKKKKKNYN